MAASPKPSPLAPTPAKEKTTNTNNPFDGTWSVTVSGPDVSRHYLVEVKNGVVQFQQGTRGQPGWYEVDGKIEADGRALLRVSGLVPYGSADKSPPGKPFDYQVICHFDSKHGSGRKFTYARMGPAQNFSGANKHPRHFDFERQ